MITITRLLARQLRSVFRRAGFARPPHGQSNAITFIASPAGLQIRAAFRDIAIECQLPGPYSPLQFAVPYEFLAACEGSREDGVNLTCLPDGKVRIAWSDRGVPTSAVYDDCQAQVLESFPGLPESFASVSPDLLPALRDAAATAADSSPRYSLDCVQLRGNTGEIIATDSSQLLSQNGFQFPWTGDALIRHAGVFAAPELSLYEQVELGRTQTHLVIRVGVWTVFFLIEKELRYPEMRDIIPRADTPGTRCHLEPQDAAFLARTLRRLPGNDIHNSPVTLDLNGHVAIRAQAENDPQITELVLSRSQAVGEPMRVSTNRIYLERMVELGFDEVLIPSDDVPLLCQDQDGRRKLIWMRLHQDSALPPSPDCVRIDSAQDQEPRPESHSPVNRISNRSSTLSKSRLNSESKPEPAAAAAPASVATQTNGHSAPAPTAAPINGHAQAAAETNGNGGHSEPEINQAAGDSIREAELLKESLRHTLVRTNRLIAALRHQKKQARLVATTLASLRELQSVG